MNARNTTLAAALACLSLGTVAAAAPTSVDRTFMTEAAADGLAEVELGRLASEKGSSEAVRDFGKMMVGDHSRANAELAALAKQEGVDLPDAPRPPHRALKAKLERLSGAEFDSAYMAAMVKDHEKAVRDFTREATGGGDAEVKAWAAKTVPGLRKHLEEARVRANGRAKASHRH